MEFLLHLYVVISIIVGCGGRESYTITRHNSDIFQVPSWMCSDSGSECKSFHKEAFSTGRNCKCACPYGAATFGWNKRKWTCIDNSEVRKQSGCTHRFESEHSKTSPLKVMKKGEAASVDLSSPSCDINFSSSRYLNCDGTWDGLGLNQNSGNDFIKFKSKKFKWKTRDESDLTYKLKIIKIEDSLAGQVVKLQIQCNGLKTSCILFKIFGEITCPVDPRQQLVSSPFLSSKPSSSSSSSSFSSGTMAAVVIVVILIIIIAAFVTFVIWKRKRGESLGVIDRLTRSGKRKSSKTDDNTYAEIHVHSHQGPRQTRTDALKRGIINSGLESSPTNLHQHQDPLYEDADFVLPVEQPITDSEGYLVPVDSPLYLELHPPEESVHDEKTKSDDKFKNGENEWARSSRGGGTENLDSPWYDVLEDSNDRSIDDGAGVDWQQEQNRNSVERDSVSGSGLSNAAGCHPRHLPKRRRRPPSPPRKGHEPSSDGDENKKHVRMTLAPDRQDITDVHNDSGRHDLYEGLKEDERVMSVYEALDRTAASI